MKDDQYVQFLEIDGDGAYDDSSVWSRDKNNFLIFPCRARGRTFNHQLTTYTLHWFFQISDSDHARNIKNNIFELSTRRKVSAHSTSDSTVGWVFLVNVKILLRGIPTILITKGTTVFYVQLSKNDSSDSFFFLAQQPH